MNSEYFTEKHPFWDKVLKGVSQIMLQENSLTGLFFVVGLFAAGWQFGVSVLLAAVVGTLTAELLKFPKEEIKSGLYGFSPALVGTGLIFFFSDNLLIWLLIIPGAAIAALIQRFFIKQNIPAYTFPFILTAWVFIFLLWRLTDIPPSQFLRKDYDTSGWKSVFMIPRGFGQVIFQGSLISGILFLIGVIISRPIAGAYAMAAALVGGLLSLMVNQPEDTVFLGVFGFNAVLTAIVFAGKKKSDALWVLVGVLLTVLIDNLLRNSHILDGVGGVLTFPFVAGTWVTLIIQKMFRNN